MRTAAGASPVGAAAVLAADAAAVVQFQVGEWRLHSVLGARSMADYE